MGDERENVLVTFFQANVNVFACIPSEMTGVPREVIEHHFAVHPDARPIQQKIRRQAPERQDFICDQVRKMLEAGFV